MIRGRIAISRIEAGIHRGLENGQYGLWRRGRISGGRSGGRLPLWPKKVTTACSGGYLRTHSRIPPCGALLVADFLQPQLYRRAFFCGYLVILVCRKLVNLVYRFHTTVGNKERAAQYLGITGPAYRKALRERFAPEV